MRAMIGAKIGLFVLLWAAALVLAYLFVVNSVQIICWLSKYAVRFMP